MRRIGVHLACGPQPTVTYLDPLPIVVGRQAAAIVALLVSRKATLAHHPYSSGTMRQTSSRNLALVTLTLRIPLSTRLRPRSPGSPPLSRSHSAWTQCDSLSHRFGTVCARSHAEPVMELDWLRLSARK